MAFGVPLWCLMRWSGETANALLRSALAPDHDPRAHDARVALREMCELAWHSGIPVASIIDTIKRAWMHSPDVRTLPPSEARVVLDELVSMCLAAFHACEP